MTKTIRLTMAQALLKFLDAQYLIVDGQEYKFVQGVFGIFGHGNLLGIGEALENMRGLTLPFYQGKNEQAIVHAATAFAKQKNRRQIFACTSSIGPGALNMVTGAGTATVNRIPVLLLPGDTFADRQPDPVLQQVEMPQNHGITANDAFKAVSKYWDRIQRPEQLMTAVVHAMRVLTDPAETGAVTLALPQDVQGEAYDYPEDFFRKRVHYQDRRQPAADAIHRAVELISSKKKPLIISGGGTQYSEAGESLAALAANLGIPVGTTQAGKGILPWDHRWNMGGIGGTGARPANVLAKEADLILAVGTRLQDFTTASKTQFQNPDVDFVSINVNTMDAMKLDALQIVGDAKESLLQLHEQLQQAGYAAAWERGYLDSLQEEWEQEVDRLYNSGSSTELTQPAVVGVLNEFLADDDVIVCASGSLPGDLQRLWRTRGRKSYHLEYGFSCMGYEIPAALGVKLAEPKQEVYALVGDGGYLMMHSELLTSVQEGYKINVIVFDNSGFQCIQSLQRGHGSPEGFGNEFRSREADTQRLTGRYLPIDFAGMAGSFGTKTYRAHTLDEFRDALLNSRRDQTSTLIDVKVMPGSHTDGYDSWWRVGTAQVSDNPQVVQAYAEDQAYFEKYHR